MPDLKADFQNDYSAGDPLAGELIAIDHNCRDCHVNHLHPGVRGPLFTATEDLPPVLVRGELRMADSTYEGQATTNQEYVIESILLANAYLVPGDWKVPMQSFHGQLTETEMADILAWLERFGEGDDSSAMTPPDDTAAEEETIALEMDLPEGDPQRGQEIFETGGGVISTKCINCHTLDGSEADGDNGGPTMLGIATTAAERVPGLSPEAYLLQSILDPSAYVAEGYEDRMEKSYQWLLNEEDQAALVAFLLTLE